MKRIAAAALTLLCSLAHAQTFQGRDLTGDGIADAYYHVEQNLTWLADANYYATQGNPVMVDPRSLGWSGQPTWNLLPGQVPLYSQGVAYAQTWTQGLSIGGVDGWRLPNRLVPAGTNAGGEALQVPAACNATACYEGWNWASELTFLTGVLAGSAGPFSNVMAGGYMAILPNRHDINEWVQLINPTTGASAVFDETQYLSGYVWAVHDGDIGGVTAAAVTPVPEPSTWALMAAALLFLILYKPEAVFGRYKLALLLRLAPRHPLRRSLRGLLPLDVHRC